MESENEAEIATQSIHRNVFNKKTNVIKTYLIRLYESYFSVYETGTCELIDHWHIQMDKAI